MIDLKSPFFQLVRVADVLFVGPLLIFAATLTRNDALAVAFIVTGVATIIFNGSNLIAIARE
jgi:hypothetical protein